MFVGHYAVAFAAKKTEPGLKLWHAVLAANFIDLIYPLFILAGLESAKITPGFTAVTPIEFTYPYTHSLAGTLVWSMIVGGIVYAIVRKWRASLWFSALVFSHWVLDFVSHAPDLPLYPGGMKVGLGLWYSLPATVAVEGLLFAIGFYLYFLTTAEAQRKGIFGLYTFAGLLLIIYMGALFGPPPPGEGALVGSLLSQWLLVAWAWHIDRKK